MLAARFNMKQASSLPLIDRTMLREESKAKSTFEIMFKEALLEIQHERRVLILSEPFSLVVRQDGKPSLLYKPDFLFPENYMNGKPLVVEPHGAKLITIPYLEKFKAASETYGTYAVLASHYDAAVINRAIGADVGSYVGRYVHIDVTSGPGSGVRSVKDIIGKILNQTHLGIGSVPKLMDILASEQSARRQ